MARVKKFLDSRQSDNQERWLVSYADFITLLFAFFVVMYAVSSVNEAKYRVLSDSISSAFGQQSPGQRAAAPSGPPLQPVQRQSTTQVQAAARRAAIARAQQEQMRDIARSINSALDALVSHGDVRVLQSPRGITVEINASVLFAPGQAVLRDESRKLLRPVVDVLRTGEHGLQVEGHTDDAPISNAQFPSNWELSTARAASVVRLFIEDGADPRRLAAVGYGEFRPVESNATAAGRARNRRVTLTVLAADPDQPTEIPLSAEPGPFTPQEFSVRP